MNIDDIPIGSDERMILWYFHETREQGDFKFGMHFCFNILIVIKESM